MSNKNKYKNNPDKAVHVLSQLIIDFLSENGGRQYNHKQISAAIGVSNNNDKNLVLQALYTLVDTGKIKEAGRGKFFLEANLPEIEGRIQVTLKGFAFVITDQVKEDIFIERGNTKNAMDGDTVRVKLKNKRSSGKPEGVVTEIVKRAHETLVGIIDINKKFAFVRPSNQRIHIDVYIPLEHLNNAKQGDKVLVKLSDWPEGAQSPFGRVIEVFGKPGTHKAEMHAIMAEFNLPLKFSKEVEDFTNNLSDNITEAEIAKRRDFRQTLTFTIDPYDAKDFDDALSVKFLRDDKEHGKVWEVGVHIADVSYYVSPNTILDREAFDRATSVYLVDRVVPMLPEILSNQICSLRPHEDKFTYSVVFEISEDAHILDQWFGRTVIHSARRFTYEEAQEIIETGKGDHATEILLLDKMAKIMRGWRLKNGALELHSQEVKFKLDEDGKPLGVFMKVQKDSNKLIEEFMLLANKAVASLMGKPDGQKQIVPLLYRIHDLPSEEKIGELMTFVKSFGYKLPTGNMKSLNKALNTLFTEITDKHTSEVIQTFAIRCMAKAVYSPDNIGHFGLAFDYYAHFTSPIRRYPDLIVHRILTDYLIKKEPTKIGKLESWGKHCSAQEKKAAEAERASIKYKQVEFMSAHLGEYFMGIISGLTEWGMYVELDENKCEGMVSLKGISEDNYVFDERTYTVRGSRKGKVFRLGDPIKVQVVRTDLEMKQIDFELVTEDF
jgi:ribonuclease R